MKKGKVWKIILIVLLVLIVVLVGGYFGIRAYGKHKLEKKGGDTKPVIETQDGQVEKVDENSVRYQGKVYTFNEDVMNFVFMGIDQSAEQQADEGQNGRADVIVLVSVDHKNKKVTMFNINRNTMTDIAIYDQFGNYLRQSVAQIALSHTYGDGKEGSAQLVCDAVSNLFYGLPIHGYFALNLDVIPIINDAVGGVTVTLQKDYTEVNESYVVGATVRLNGDMAVRYVRQRDYQEGEANEARMERQKEYMKNFLGQARQAMSSDLTLPLKLYQAVQPYMVTDITADQVVYLASQVMGYAMSDEMQTLQGTVSHGPVFSEYHIDDTALYQTVINTYYEEKEENPSS